MAEKGLHPASTFSAQLREACKITRARWAAWLTFAAGGWTIPLQFNLVKSRQASLQEFVKHPETTSWLAGALSSGRIRSRQTGADAPALGCQRVYVFPNVLARCALLVGSDGFEKTAENLFRILALNAPPGERGHPPAKGLDRENAARKTSLPKISAASRSGPAPGLSFQPPDEGSLEFLYHPEAALKKVLVLLAGEIDCDAAFLAVRSGDIFRIEAVWNYPEKKRGIGFSTAEYKILAEIDANRRGVVLEDIQQSEAIENMALFGLGEMAAPGIMEMPRAWMGIPIVLGKRVIGLSVFIASRPGIFTSGHVQRMTAQVSRLAHAVENAIVFAETARYLQQLALLNEMASAASLGVDTHEIARRVLERLRRIFRTPRAGVVLLSPDQKTLREYGGSAEDGQARAYPDERSPLGQAIALGKPFRTGEHRHATGQDVTQPGIERRSELAAPLKYQGTVIGALTLESEESNAFTLQDEQLLIGIASHLAGLFENMRLNEETRERAQKLQDSVRQLEAVRATALDIGSAQGSLDTLLQRVVRRARELVDARGAELGFVELEKGVVIISISDTPWSASQAAPPFREIPLMADVTGRVAAFGEPLVVNDYPAWSGRWSPEQETPFKTVAGVPLKFQGQVIGALTVSDDRPEKLFRPEDIQILELLAPLVTVWIRNARLYQELEERIEAQQLAENSLVRSARLAAVGEMAAGVAHELNNPLTTVSGFVELVLEELPKDSPHRPDLELALREAQRARGVVRRLLDFSRPAENQRVRTDLNELVSDVLTLVQHLVRTGGVEMHIELWDDLPWITVDPAQIKQVLLNLIHNAIQAMPDGGTLAVKTTPVQREGRSWLSINISDTGVGIPKDNLERIFEPFFTTRQAGQGTGLGLSVSYGIVAEHGGSIEVESQPGQGSCFLIYLPVDSEHDTEGFTGHD